MFLGITCFSTKPTAPRRPDERWGSRRSCGERELRRPLGDEVGKCGRDATTDDSADDVRDQRPGTAAEFLRRVLESLRLIFQGGDFGLDLRHAELIFPGPQLDDALFE
jgi:hypothetical protein